MGDYERDEPNIAGAIGEILCWAVCVVLLTGIYPIMCVLYPNLVRNSRP